MQKQKPACNHPPELGRSIPGAQKNRSRLSIKNKDDANRKHRNEVSNKDKDNAKFHNLSFANSQSQTQISKKHQRSWQESYPATGVNVTKIAKYD